MSNGKQHTQATVLVSLGMLFHSPEMCLGGLLGIFLTPDLDLIENKNIYSVHVIKTLLPAWVAELYKRYWWFYGKLVPHRSKISHIPIFSTFIRFIYQFFILLAIYFAFFPEKTVNLLKNQGFLGFFMGLIIVDIVHIFMDITSTFLKQTLIYKRWFS